MPLASDGGESSVVCRGNEFVEHTGVDRRAVGGDLDRARSKT
jgi:hypothetical protein